MMNLKYANQEKYNERTRMKLKRGQKLVGKRSSRRKQSKNKTVDKKLYQQLTTLRGDTNSPENDSTNLFTLPKQDAVAAQTTKSNKTLMSKSSQDSVIYVGTINPTVIDLTKSTSSLMEPKRTKKYKSRNSKLTIRTLKHKYSRNGHKSILDCKILTRSTISITNSNNSCGSFWEYKHFTNSNSNLNSVSSFHSYFSRSSLKDRLRTKSLSLSNSFTNTEHQIQSLCLKNHEKLINFNKNDDEVVTNATLTLNGEQQVVDLIMEMEKSEGIMEKLPVANLNDVENNCSLQSEVDVINFGAN